MTPTNSDDGQSGSTDAGPTLLLVEDNPGDARLIEEAISAHLTDRLSVVRTGDEALDFVHRRDEYVDAPRPDLVLLDWRLPGMGGDEVLQELNTNPASTHIPVIVLTGPQSERGVRESYEQNANACISKNGNPAGFEATVRAFEDFWLSAA